MIQNKDPTLRSTIREALAEVLKDAELNKHTPAPRMAFMKDVLHAHFPKKPENKDPTIKSRLPEWSRAFLLHAYTRSGKAKLRFVKQRRILDEILNGRK
jgi:hypothetical protein